MGRKSIAPRRREEILDAFERCIEKHGFAGSSTRRISEEANMNQPMISHYFGNKRSMVDALIHRIMEDYTSRLGKALGTKRGESRIGELLDFLFGPGLLGNKTKRNLLGQLLGSSLHDENLRSRLQQMYASFLKIGAAELHQAFPGITPKEARPYVYGILSLAVGNDAVLSVGLPYANRKNARICAETLIAGLKTGYR